MIKYPDGREYSPTKSKHKLLKIEFLLVIEEWDLKKI